MILRRIAAMSFVLVVVLSGCATPGVDPRDAAAWRRVAVVSVVAPRMTQQNVGVTVFGNEKAVFDVTDQRLDAAYQAALEEALRRAGRYEVVHIDPAPDLKAIYEWAGPWEAPAYMTPNFDKVAPRLRELAAQAGVDVVLVLTGRVSEDYFGSSNQTLFGLGIYTRSMGDRTRVANVHLIASLYAVPAATGSPLAGVFFQKETGTSTRFRQNPATALDPAVARRPYATMTDAQREVVRVAAAALVTPEDALHTVRRLLPSSP